MTKGNISGCMYPTLYRGFDVGCNPHSLTSSLNSVGGAVTELSNMYVVVTVYYLGKGYNWTLELQEWTVYMKENEQEETVMNPTASNEELWRVR